jgi:uncharacterized protein
VILCEGFSTLREAATEIGFPRWMTLLSPRLWETVNEVRGLKPPVLVVHSDGDRMFPVSMAQRVYQACGEDGELIVIPGLSHNEPIVAPTVSYWGPIVQWAMQKTAAAVRD